MGTVKLRPIAPSTKHPMKTVLHRAGKAWHFISTQLTGEHFVINSTRDVPKFFGRAQEILKSHAGELQITVQDIEGCYPNMPKHIIVQAARDITAELQKEGKEGVWVPKRGKQKCQWTATNKQKHRLLWMPLIDLVEILQFSLDHAVVKMPDGTYKRQVQGIPMGDALSPGATICTCAWMEKEYMRSLH